MKIIVRGETDLRVTADGAGLEIEEEGGHFSPLHMLAGSLGTCTVAVLADWAARAELDPGALEIDVRWDFVEDPYRVGRFAMEIRWPGLPEERTRAAERVAASCTVHHTFEHPPEVELGVSR